MYTVLRKYALIIAVVNVSSLMLVGVQPRPMPQSPATDLLPTPGRPAGTLGPWDVGTVGTNPGNPNTPGTPGRPAGTWGPNDLGSVGTVGINPSNPDQPPLPQEVPGNPTGPLTADGQNPADPAAPPATEPPTDSGNGSPNNNSAPNEPDDGENFLTTITSGASAIIIWTVLAFAVVLLVCYCIYRSRKNRDKSAAHDDGQWPPAPALAKGEETDEDDSPLGRAVEAKSSLSRNVDLTELPSVTDSQPLGLMAAVAAGGVGLGAMAMKKRNSKDNASEKNDGAESTYSDRRKTFNTSQSAPVNGGSGSDLSTEMSYAMSPLSDTGAGKAAIMGSVAAASAGAGAAATTFASPPAPASMSEPTNPFEESHRSVLPATEHASSGSGKANVAMLGAAAAATGLAGTVYAKKKSGARSVKSNKSAKSVERAAEPEMKPESAVDSSVLAVNADAADEVAKAEETAAKEPVGGKGKKLGLFGAAAASIGAAVYSMAPKRNSTSSATGEEAATNAARVNAAGETEYVKLKSPTKLDAAAPGAAVAAATETTGSESAIDEVSVLSSESQILARASATIPEPLVNASEAVNSADKADKKVPESSSRNMMGMFGAAAASIGAAIYATKPSDEKAKVDEPVATAEDELTELAAVDGVTTTGTIKTRASSISDGKSFHDAKSFQTGGRKSVADAKSFLTAASRDVDAQSFHSAVSRSEEEEVTKDANESGKQLEAAAVDGKADAVSEQKLDAAESVQNSTRSAEAPKKSMFNMLGAGMFGAAAASIGAAVMSNNDNENNNGNEQPAKTENNVAATPALPTENVGKQEETVNAPEAEVPLEKPTFDAETAAKKNSIIGLYGADEATPSENVSVDDEPKPVVIEEQAIKSELPESTEKESVKPVKESPSSAKKSMFGFLGAGALGAAAAKIGSSAMSKNEVSKTTKPVKESPKSSKEVVPEISEVTEPVVPESVNVDDVKESVVLKVDSMPRSDAVDKTLDAVNTPIEEAVKSAEKGGVEPVKESPSSKAKSMFGLLGAGALGAAAVKVGKSVMAKKDSTNETSSDNAAAPESLSATVDSVKSAVNDVVETNKTDDAESPSEKIDGIKSALTETVEAPAPDIVKETLSETVDAVETPEAIKEAVKSVETDDVEPVKQIPSSAKKSMFGLLGAGALGAAAVKVGKSVMSNKESTMESSGAEAAAPESLSKAVDTVKSAVNNVVETPKVDDAESPSDKVDNITSALTETVEAPVPDIVNETLSDAVETPEAIEEAVKSVETKDTEPVKESSSSTKKSMFGLLGAGALGAAAVKVGKSVMSNKESTKELSSAEAVAPESSSKAADTVKSAVNNAVKTPKVDDAESPSDKIDNIASALTEPVEAPVPDIEKETLAETVGAVETPEAIKEAVKSVETNDVKPVKQSPSSAKKSMFGLLGAGALGAAAVKVGKSVMSNKESTMELSSDEAVAPESSSKAVDTVKSAVNNVVETPKVDDAESPSDKVDNITSAITETVEAPAPDIVKETLSETVAAVEKPAAIEEVVKSVETNDAEPVKERPSSTKKSMFGLLGAGALGAAAVKVGKSVMDKKDSTDETSSDNAAAPESLSQAVNSVKSMVTEGGNVKTPSVEEIQSIVTDKDASVLDKIKSVAETVVPAKSGAAEKDVNVTEQASKPMEQVSSEINVDIVDKKDVDTDVKPVSAEKVDLPDQYKETMHSIADKAPAESMESTREATEDTMTTVTQAPEEVKDKSLLAKMGAGFMGTTAAATGAALMAKNTEETDDTKVTDAKADNLFTPALSKLETFVADSPSTDVRAMPSVIAEVSKADIKSTVESKTEFVKDKLAQANEQTLPPAAKDLKDKAMKAVGAGALGATAAAIVTKVATSSPEKEKTEQSPREQKFERTKAENVVLPPSPSATESDNETDGVEAQVDDEAVAETGDKENIATAVPVVDSSVESNNKTKEVDGMEEPTNGIAPKSAEEKQPASPTLAKKSRWSGLLRKLATGAAATGAVGAMGVAASSEQESNTRDQLITDDVEPIEDTVIVKESDAVQEVNAAADGSGAIHSSESKPDSIAVEQGYEVEKVGVEDKVPAKAENEIMAETETEEVEAIQDVEQEQESVDNLVEAKNVNFNVETEGDVIDKLEETGVQVDSEEQATAPAVVGKSGKGKSKWLGLFGSGVLGATAAGAAMAASNSGTEVANKTIGSTSSTTESMQKMESPLMNPTDNQEQNVGDANFADEVDIKSDISAAENAEVTLLASNRSINEPASLEIEKEALPNVDEPQDEPVGDSETEMPPKKSMFAKIGAGLIGATAASAAAISAKSEKKSAGENKSETVPELAQEQGSRSAPAVDVQSIQSVEGADSLHSVSSIRAEEITDAELFAAYADESTNATSATTDAVEVKQATNSENVTAANVPLPDDDKSIHSTASSELAITDLSRRAQSLTGSDLLEPASSLDLQARSTTSGASDGGLSDLEEEETGENALVENMADEDVEKTIAMPTSPVEQEELNKTVTSAADTTSSPVKVNRFAKPRSVDLDAEQRVSQDEGKRRSSSPMLSDNTYINYLKNMMPNSKK